MARHPNVLHKINYVVNFLADTCDAPLQVYLDTFLTAFLRLLISYFALDLIQIITGFARPKKALAKSRRRRQAARGGKHGKPRTWRTAWLSWLAFDPYEEIGRNMRGAEVMAGREVTAGTIHMWTIYTHLQRIAFWWMVIDLTTDFWYNWFSAVNATRFCQAQRNGWLHAVGPDQSKTGLLNPFPTTCGTIEKQRGPCFWAVSSGGYTGRTGAFVFSAGLRPEAPIPATTLQLVVTDLSTGTERRNDYDPDNTDDPTAIAFHLIPTHVYAIGTYGNGDYEVINPQVTIVGLDQIE